MKRIKRIGTILLVMIVMLGLLALPAAAEEVVEPENTPVEDVVPEVEANTPVDDVPVADEPTDNVTEENNTLVSRVYEWAEEHCGEILSALSCAAMAGYSIYQKGKNGTFIQGIGRVLKSQGTVESASQLVTEGMNKLEEQQAQLNGYYEQYSKNEDQRNKVTAALLVEVMAMLELQHISYINNASIPQSMKNLATSKYARCLSVINDDAEIKAAYDEMRGLLGIAEETSNEKTDT